MAIPFSPCPSFFSHQFILLSSPLVLTPFGSPRFSKCFPSLLPSPLPCFSLFPFHDLLNFAVLGLFLMRLFALFLSSLCQLFSFLPLSLLVFYFHVPVLPPNIFSVVLFVPVTILNIIFLRIFSSF